jgi:triosephosphate isomerase
LHWTGGWHRLGDHVGRSHAQQLGALAHLVARRKHQFLHASIRRVLADLYDSRFAARTRIIYGGSVNAKNARAIFAGPDIDGGLIGGASLKADDFASICRAAAEAWSAAGGH